MLAIYDYLGHKRQDYLNKSHFCARKKQRKNVVMKLMKCLAIGLLAGVSSYTSAAMAEELSIQEAVNIGVVTNPEYGVVANNRQATDEELRQAKGLYLPSVDAVASIGVARIDSPTTRANNSDNDTFYPTRAGITLTQMLFDGFDTKNEVERQYSRVESASHRARETAEFVGLDISQSYLEVLRQRELLQIARQNVDDHESMLIQIESAENAGRTTLGDTSQAQARLAAAQAAVSNVLEALRQAESRFKAEVGVNPDILVMPDNPAALVGANVDEAVEVSLAEGPTLKVFESDIDVAQQEYEQSGNTFYPQVDLQLNAEASDDLAGEGGRDELSANVIANWNLYRGGIDTALRRELIYRTAQTKEERANQGRLVEDDVRQTWASMVAAGERAQAFAAQSNANVQVLQAYRDQFDLDRRTLLDVLDSQNELFTARSNAINSQYLQMLAAYRLLAIQGRLLPAMGVETPKDAIVASN